MLNKKNLEIVDCSASDNGYGSQILRGLHITPTHTVATDGRKLIMVELPDVDLEEFPVVSVPISYIKESFTVSKDTVKKLMKNIPAKAMLPILENVGVQKNGKTEVSFVVNDLENETVIRGRILEESGEEGEEYPDFMRVFPTEEPQAEFYFNPKLMIELLKHFYGDECRYVKLSVFAVDKPAIIEQGILDEQKITALLMPIRTIEE